MTFSNRAKLRIHAKKIHIKETKENDDKDKVSEKVKKKDELLKWMEQGLVEMEDRTKEGEKMTFDR